MGRRSWYEHYVRIGPSCGEDMWSYYLDGGTEGWGLQAGRVEGCMANVGKTNLRPCTPARPQPHAQHEEVNFSRLSRIWLCQRPKIKTKTETQFLRPTRFPFSGWPSRKSRSRYRDCRWYFWHVRGVRRLGCANGEGRSNTLQSPFQQDHKTPSQMDGDSSVVASRAAPLEDSCRC